MSKESEAKSETKEKKGQGILPIILAAVVSGAMAVGTVVLIGPRLLGQQAIAKTSADEGKKGDGQDLLTYTYPLGEFAVNLSEPDRYLRAEVELEIEEPQGRPSAPDKKASKAKKEGHGQAEKSDAEEPAQTLPNTPGVAELREKNAQIRDLVVDAFSEQSYSELLDTRTRKGLRTRLQKKLNLILEDCQVSAVFLTRFLMQ